ncbi:fungal-specific transcription factor domain-containing protein [Thelonectria olida]|uniref:Fungal-specific transcription factor domain-containing protein n=1 Tax=Thelonectria olida TaxID=1576542 RepID=A0A9P9ANF3_9HYPO|nr:fungal-specific transcription factor domain-containing protein [Thelonectria olida]
MAEEPASCRECRRRRVKCDGTIPVCSICQKYKRHCLYDKHSRTRLTRKQLTILEERLEKAEALLRRHFTNGQIAEMMDGAAAAMPGPGSLATPSPSSTPAPPVHSLMQLPAPAPTPASNAHLSGSGAAPPEMTPSVADNFEWNERESSWSMYDPSRGSTVDAAEGGSPQTIMDGMATLTVDDHNRGYLGAVSGAALLRQILSARTDGEEVDAGVPLQPLESLFQQQSGHSQWFRTQAMLTRVAVENLIDAFFSLYHSTFPIVHEPTFRAQYEGSLPRPDKDNWNILANILAALGSFVSSNSADATDLPIFQAVQKGLFADNLEVGTLTLVQAFGLSANYLQKRNKPNSGYNYGGLALRLAIGLGLHKEFEGAMVSPLQREIRRRIWWCLCVLDVGATITYGRPLNWPQAGVEAALPRNIYEKDLVSDSTCCPSEVDGLTIYTYIRVQSAYHLRTMSIYNRLITSPFPSAAELVALDDGCIGAWLAQVPPYYLAFPPPGSEHALGLGISKWRYRNLRIVMYRPFLVRWALRSSSYCQENSSSIENLAVFRCLDAAKETIASIEEYWTSRSHSRLDAWYVLYFLFQATLIPLHCLRQNPLHSLASGWRSQIRSSLAVMEAMAELSPNSSKCRDISMKLCWPHLEEETTQVQDDSTLLLPNLADGEEASMMSGYDMWCQLMSNASTGAPMYQWGNLDDQHLSFFL